MRSALDAAAEPSARADHSHCHAAAYPRPLRWMGGAIAALLCLGAATLPAQAINVYIMSSGDPALDTTVQTLLAANGHTATIGDEYWEFDGTESLAGFDAVYMQVNYNHNASGGEMPETGEAYLRDWILISGGGLVTSEWAVYKAANGSFQTLQQVFPAEAFPSAAGYDARLPADSLTFQEIVNDPTLAAALPSSFVFMTDSIAAGALTECQPRAAVAGSTEFYRTLTATGFPTCGLAGAVVGAGRVININAVAGANEIADPSFGRLLVNSLDWASAGQPTAGVDLGVHVAAPGCRLSEYAVAARVTNFGSDTSGPVTLTVDLPAASIATYAGATPPPTTVTPTTLVFDLPPLAGGAAAHADVSITLTPVSSGIASVTVTAATTTDVNLSNNGAVASTNMPTIASGHVEIGDAPELAGGQPPEVEDALTVIEGTLTGEDADMFMIRVVDWSQFMALTESDPSVINACADSDPIFDTALFLFDAAGRGIAFNEDGAGSRGYLEPGNPLYANRTNGEIVWLAIAGYDRDPMSGGAELWADSPYETTRAPDGPGAAGVIDAWAGSANGEGTYRIELQGVASATLAPGTNLAVELSTPLCRISEYTVTARVTNFGADASGPVTLTVDLPSASIATYAGAAPPPTTVTPTTLVFDLPPLAGGAAAYADVAITLTPVATGTASITATAATTADIDLSDNTAAGATMVSAAPPGVYVEMGDAAQLDGGQVPETDDVLIAIEGALGFNDADMYKVRVTDWSQFTANTSENPGSFACSGGAPVSDTALFLFDASGRGIAFSENGVGWRGVLESGNPLYANRTNGETVWLAIAGWDVDPMAEGAQIWADLPANITRGPDGPGAGGPVDAWAGFAFEQGTYRIELAGVAPATPVAGVDLGLLLEAPGCQVDPYTVTAQITNFGGDVSGPITLTVDLPDASIATYADATPAPSLVTPTSLTFDLPPLAGGALADVSITFAPVTAGAGGDASILATVTTTADVDPSNNSATASTTVPTTTAPPGVHFEVGDAPELAGGQQPQVDGALVAIEGTLTSNDADMYTLRVVDWGQFMATTSVNPSIGCGGGTFLGDTALFLFDGSGAGIAFNEDGAGVRGYLEPGNPLYASRTNGEIVWLAIAGYDRDPMSGGAELWADSPYETTRAPDGPGAAGAIDAWAGSAFGEGLYRIELVGVASVPTCAADLDRSGLVDVFDLLAYLDLWFMSDPGADIDGAAGVDVFDLLAYLDGWFAGC